MNFLKVLSFRKKGVIKWVNCKEDFMSIKYKVNLQRISRISLNK